MEESYTYNLIMRYLNGTATAEEAGELDSWKAASPENEKFFKEVEQIWRSSRDDSPDRFPNIDEEWKSLQARLGLESEKRARILSLRKQTDPIPSRFRTQRILAMAASLLVIAALAALFRSVFQGSELQAVVAQNAEQKEIQLPDGSSVRLHPGTRIQFPATFGDASREISLSGQAFFQIKADGRSFVVTTENAVVKVLGTEFDVWARQNQTRVTVREGRVSLQTREREKQVILEKEQMSIVVADRDPEPAKTINSQQLLGWIENRIVFDATPLGQVARELEFLYDVRIELTDARLANRQVTAHFKDASFAAVLGSICQALSLEYRKDNGTYKILPNLVE